MYFTTTLSRFLRGIASGELAAMVNPGGFEVGGSRGLFADKHLPSIQNNLSKVWGTHTVKGGVYWEYIINNQPANGFTNGQLAFDVSNARSSGSPYADLLLGRINNYQEQSFNRLNNIGYHTFEFFVQDAWKITRRLSLDLGLRASHFQPWQDREGFGFAVFDYSQYRPGSAPADYSGFSWNKRDPNVPLGGFPSRALYWAPRFGLAFDIFGTGKHGHSRRMGTFLLPYTAVHCRDWTPRPVFKAPPSTASIHLPNWPH